MVITYSKQNLKLIKDAISEGKVISFLTDTLFALACDATNTKAIEKLFSIKKRPIEISAPIMVASLEQGLRYAKFNEVALKLAAKFWPGALTMVLPARENNGLSPLAVRGSTVALRVPGNNIALEILEAACVPLLGTSANISGGEDLNDAYEIESTLGEELDLVIEYAGKHIGLASTIIKIDDETKIIRDGAIGRSQILREIHNLIEG